MKIAKTFTIDSELAVILEERYDENKSNVVNMALQKFLNNNPIDKLKTIENEIKSLQEQKEALLAGLENEMKNFSIKKQEEAKIIIEKEKQIADKFKFEMLQRFEILKDNSVWQELRSIYTADWENEKVYEYVRKIRETDIKLGYSEIKGLLDYLTENPELIQPQLSNPQI